jgi:acyl transferase domain-containing protein/cation diffusion facilitator CzcD-associated flavoprotein CzcO/acyl carrier protein/SAM-dependent methyltransferase
MSNSNSYTVVIVGAGLSGICMGIALKKLGVDFVILEKTNELSGTWSQNIYPGCGCDIPMFAYCYSFEMFQGAAWPKQPEILKYFEHCVKKYGIEDNIRYQSSVKESTFDQTQQRWNIELDNNEKFNTKFLVNATGQLNTPNSPNIEGMDNFENMLVHSAQYPAGLDVKGKSVSIVGNGATALQIVESLQPKVDSLTVFARSPKYVYPRVKYSPLTINKMKNDPEYWLQVREQFIDSQDQYRLLLDAHPQFDPFVKDSKVRDFYSQSSSVNFDEFDTFYDWMSDKNMRPEYPTGCSRPLASNTFHHAIQSSNVTLVSDPIECIASQSINTSVKEYESDIIIFATGFSLNNLIPPYTIQNGEGKTLSEAWTVKPDTYLGMVTAEFPNLFFLYGPNTNTNASSVTFFVEQQVNYIGQIVQEYIARPFESIEIKSDVLQQYVQWLEDKNRSVSEVSDCSSWYQNANKLNISTFPGNFRDYEKLTENFMLEEYTINKPKNGNKIPETDLEALKIRAKLVELFSNTTLLPLTAIEPLGLLRDYPLDSILLVDFIKKINISWKLKLDATIFFEYTSFQELSIYISSLLVKSISKDTNSKLLSTSSVPEFKVLKSPNLKLSVEQIKSLQVKPKAMPRSMVAQEPDNNSNRLDKEDIAIIGAHGYFPQSSNLETFWDNLVQGKNCISEVPKERWDWKDFYGSPEEGDKTKVKWAGFIDDIDQFDPLFFKISPKEAELMDPQHRLFLQCSWELIESAGYNPNALSGRKIGVILGVNLNDYAELISSSNTGYNVLQMSGLMHLFGANRLSYLLGFTGPSEVIDTACSSSLIAIHRAIHSIRQDHCEMMLAGGTNLILTPKMHLLYSKASMLSQEGSCKPFSDNADGYARGEGVAAVLLKRMSLAKSDGDTVIGVIRGSAENHGGKSNSLTAPNPKLQAQLIEDAMLSSNVDPRTIGYIECHGTGTPLGDPIEINGILKAYQNIFKRKNLQPAESPYCGLGSVKGNVGHLETTAGIVGVIKVLLSFKHQYLPKTLSPGSINSKIHLEGSPFYLVRENQAWDPIIVDGEVQPRRAGISSFGAGGSNAHLILEEYSQPISASVVDAVVVPVIIPLSARTVVQLKQMARNLLGFINNNSQKSNQFDQQFSGSTSPIDLSAMSFTLQVGREVMEERLGLIVNSVDELSEKLQDYIEGQQNIVDVYQSSAIKDKAVINIISQDQEMKVVIEKWIEDKNFSKLLDLWARGLDFDWNKLYGSNKPNRINLPTYPFSKQRYWFEDSAEQKSDSSSNASTRLHPLLHANTSDLSQQSYLSIFTGEEFFLKDHQVNTGNETANKVLPAVAYLEMARAAVELASPKAPKSMILELRNTVWAQSIIVSEKTEVNIALFANDEAGSANAPIEYEIYSEDNENEVIHCQGQAAFINQPVPEKLDIDQIKEQMTKGKVNADRIYAAFSEMGINYGPAHRGITAIYSGEKQLLAKLHLPAVVEQNQNDYLLHPSIMDSALQSTIGLLTNLINIPSQPSLPFALESLQIISSLQKEMFVWLRYSPGSKAEDKLVKFDIDLIDQAGNVCVQMQGFSTRVFGGELRATGKNTPTHDSQEEIGTELQSLVLVWEPVSLNIDKNIIVSNSTRILVLASYPSQLNWVQNSFPDAQSLLLDKTLTIESIQAQLVSYTFDQLVWVAPDVAQEGQLNDSEHIITEQERGVLAVFKIIKALLKLGYESKELQWTIITSKIQEVKKDESIQPAHAGIVGLVGSLAKEYAHWNLRLLDVDILEAVSAKECLSLPWEKQGNVLAFRQGEWFTQGLARLDVLDVLDDSPSTYKQNGVYVVIGGAGGIGEVWSRFMIEKYQAKIIWIGRRKINSDINKKIGLLAELGPAPVYISADATKKEALEQALSNILENYHSVEGVVHSAIVLQDQSLARMEESKFRASLSAKVDISVNIEQVFGRHNLDFILFFSSAISFTKTFGQSNYAAGCTFKDSFAQSLNNQLDCSVKTINWGFWGKVGIVTDEHYQIRMEQMGIGSIEPDEAMGTLQTLMGSDISQMALIKTLNDQAISDISFREKIKYYSKTASTESLQIQKVSNAFSADKQKTIQKGGLPPEAMNDLATEILASSLFLLGLFQQGKSRISDLSLNKQPAAFYDRWLSSCIEHLHNKNIVSLDFTLNFNVRELGDLWAEWDANKSAWTANPNLKAQIILLEACLKALPEILQGNQLATDVMFPNSSMQLVEGIYKENALADYFNEAMGNTLSECIKQKQQSDKESKFRILEIGAGTGGTTAKLIPILTEHTDFVAEYCYTDLSRAFLMHAEEKYQPKFPALTTAIFDVSKPLISQSILTDKYDVVIATNVLHATPNIRETLRNAKAVLKKNGVILLNEIGTWTLFSHLTFGLLEGWWLYEDDALRLSGSPGLTPEKWHQVLKEEGFESIFFPLEASHSLGQQVIVASSDGRVRQKIPKQATKLIVNKNPETEVVLLDKIQQSTQVGSDNHDGVLREKSTHYFQELIAETLKMRPQQLGPDQPFEQYGLDSILVIQLTNNLRKAFPDITSTLFFEVQSIDGLVDHFIENRKEELEVAVSATTYSSDAQISKIDSTKTVEINTEENKIVEQKPISSRIVRRGRQQAIIETPRSATKLNIFDVAIIGLTGRYPQSKNLNEFWANLSSGNNCISEIPAERWKWADYYDEEKGTQGKIYTKWGGFIEGIDLFDPLFFKISPKEAKRMDPQERLFLESCYHAIEDAGYTPDSLDSDNKIGVFVGVMNSRYTQQPNYFSIANRVSYTFNFHGPSMAVDTACSSSLTAIHLGLESIYSGLSKCVIAGGVNLIIDPVHFLMLTDLTMLSSGNQSKSFGEHADGFVDAEGVGALVLKSLEQAELDKDHIYGVLKGSSINAGGKTNGYTVPNPIAQSALVIDALERSNLVAEQLSYIEAHGTGTALGDPIEIAGLTRAFKKTSNLKQFCAIGSLKSNIGHCESAAGIAGLTKVLLQLKHKQLVPSLHSKATNPEIDFKQTPFKLQQDLETWQRPSRSINGVDQEIPLMAGISSFGAGGANAHVIVEEYQQPIKLEQPKEQNIEVVIPLSARTAEQLKQKAHALLGFIKAFSVSQQQQTLSTEEQASTPFKTIDLESIAYTLQIGREAMDERLGFIVSSVEQLAGKLQAFIGDEQNIKGFYQGQVKSNKESIFTISHDDDMKEAIDRWIVRKKFSKLLDLWAKGLNLDWNKFYGGNQPQRISLPTYPFARQRYWIDTKAEVVATAASPVQLHPLLHSNTSDLSQISYTSSFSGQEFFLKESLEAEQKILPVAGFFEMARVAVLQASPAEQSSSSMTLNNTVWTGPAPIIVNNRINIALFARQTAQIDFEIYSQDNYNQEDEQEVIYCQGQANFGSQSVIAKLDIAQLKQSMVKAKLETATLVQGLTSLYQGNKQLLAELSLPAKVESNQNEYVLHPDVMDAAMRVTVNLIAELNPALNQSLFPFAVDSIEIFSACTEEMLVWVRPLDDNQLQGSVISSDLSTKLNIDLCDQQGNVCVQMCGITYQQETVTPREEPTEPRTNLAKATMAQEITFAHSTTENIVPKRVSFGTHKMQTFTPFKTNKPTGISLLNVVDNIAVKYISLGTAKRTSAISLSTVAVESPQAESTNSASSLVSLFDNGNGIYNIQITDSKVSYRLSEDLIDQLIQAIVKVQQAGLVKVLIISGTERGFLSGGRKEYNQAVEKKLYQTIIDFPYPIIAVMPGGGAGAGFLVGALCDFMVCSQQGVYSYTDLQQDLYPEENEYNLFKERFGEVRAKEFLYLSSTSTGEELQSKGWSCPVIPQEQVEKYAEKLASLLAKKTQDSLRLLKQHLVRRLSHLTKGLTTVAPLLLTKALRQENSKIISPAKNIILETNGETILVIRIGQTNKKYDTKALVKSLSDIFSQVNQSNQYRAIVLCSEYSDFLPDAEQKITDSILLEFQQLLLDSSLPVIAALDRNARGIAWYISQFCDACIYNEKGHYSFENVWHSRQLDNDIAIIFSHRFGYYLGQEILLTGTDYSGAELKQRQGALFVTEQDQVLSRAIKLAELWAELPLESLVNWKKTTVQTIREEIKNQPDWSIQKDEIIRPESQTQDNQSVEIYLTSNVVTATYHPDGVVEVKMHDRQAKNMFSDDLIQGINEVFAHIEQTPGYKVVILTGYENYFSSGGTKESLLAIQKGKAKFTDLDIYHVAMNCKIPVIAAMQGHGIGGGWNLGMFADFNLFSEESQYFSPYMKFGFTPGAGSTLIFPNKIGYDLARETMLTAQEYSGSELRNRNLSMPVLSRKKIHLASMALAKQIAQHSRSRLITFKRQLTHHLNNSLKETYQLELAMHEKTFVGQSEALENIHNDFSQIDSVTPEKASSSENIIPTEVSNKFKITETLTSIAVGLKMLLAEELHMEVADVEDDTQFIDLGMDSITGVTWVRKINKKYAVSIEAIQVYSYPTLNEFSQYIKAELEKQSTAIGDLSTGDKQLNESTFASANKNLISDSAPVLFVAAAQQSNSAIGNQSHGVQTLPIITASLKELLAQELHMQVEDIDDDTQFIDLGMDSITGVIWVRNINEKYAVSIEAIQVYSYPTLTEFSQYIKAELENQTWATDDQVAGEKQLNEPTLTSANKHLLSDSKPVLVAAVPQQSNSAIGNQYHAVQTLPIITASLKELLAQELHMQVEEIDEDTQFIDLGMDSITGVTWIRKINDKYTILIEAIQVYSYPTLIEFSQYIKTEVEKQGVVIDGLEAELYPLNKPKLAVVTMPKETALVLNRDYAQTSQRKLQSWRKQGILSVPSINSLTFQAKPIAVIGMAGQFPQANNLEEFWNNIAEGKNCISQISKDRWDINEYYKEGAPVAGKTNCQWMGSLQEYDLFDPLFFNLSPIEAERMDPQQRLFLQSCWHSVENAGYNPQSLSKSKCGVFVGCGTGDYHHLSNEKQLSAQDFTGGAISILAARISYFLNLMGPCLSIDTACSSSLVAIANACDSLTAETSDIALAGGVCVLTGPNMHIMNSQAGMLSTDGRCFTFDKRANGFVPGEGVGVVMLKRLADAQADEDIIQGVIQGWGVNQDGKSNGITAPKPEAQTGLQQDVYDKFKIDPSQIQLIETHGTGTKLGDPIEVEGLKNAFKKYTENKNYCALSSVKSNIGHGMYAAGISGFIKLILAMKHKKLPPTINFEQLNEHIELEGSPFYVNNKIQDWNLKGDTKRQAAISSFGFSGTNAHMVISEYVVPSTAMQSISVLRENNKVVVPLSAKSAEQLQQKAIDLLGFVQTQKKIDILELAYTLQIGRDAMEERLGFMVNSIEELTKKLQAYINQETRVDGIFQGQIKRNNEGINVINQDVDMKNVIIANWISNNQLSKILDLWVKGVNFDWNKFYGKVKPQRICLPNYPFAKERYWIATEESQQQFAVENKTTKSNSSLIHSLLHVNTSDFSEQSYRTSFSGNEFFLRDHLVKTDDESDKKFLPGVAYLEMARAAIEHASSKQSTPLTLNNIVWMRPIVITELKDVSIVLYENEGQDNSEGQIDFVITTQDEKQGEIIHCQGQASFSNSSNIPTLDKEQLTKQMNFSQLDETKIYPAFAKMGLNYGPAHQGIKTIYVGERQLVGDLYLPEVVADSVNEYILHPSLMDAALQSTIGLISDLNQVPENPLLPFALDVINILSACTENMFVWVRFSSGFQSENKIMKFDIELCDQDGNVCVQLQGFSVRALEPKSTFSRQKIRNDKETHNTKEIATFDEGFYEELIESVLSSEISVDEAVELEE